jgi:Domain of unknown function (DUF4386)
MLRFSDGRNFARTFTGLALIVGPILLLVGEVLGPNTDHGSSVSDNLKNLASVEAHKGRFLTGAILMMLGGLVTASGAVGLIHYLRGRKVTLGQVAAALVAMGAAVSVSFYIFAVVSYEMVSHGNLDRSQMATLLHDLNQPGSGAPLFFLFLIGVVIGLILLGIACWRRRTVPIWASVAVIAAGVLAFFGESRGVSIADFAVLTIGLGTLGWAVLSSSDESWDAPRDQIDAQPAAPPPGSEPQPTGA